MLIGMLVLLGILMVLFGLSYWFRDDSNTKIDFGQGGNGSRKNR